MGLPLKNSIRDYLIKKGYQVDDMGVNAADPVTVLMSAHTGAGDKRRKVRARESSCVGRE